MAEVERDQRTEDATPRRREEARERGQVPLSGEFVAAAGLAAGAVALAVAGPRLCTALARELTGAVARCAEMGARALDVPTSAALLVGAVRRVLGALAFVVVPTVLVCALAGVAQVGVRFASKALEADPGKLDPFRGVQKILSLRGATRTGFALAKVVLIAAVVSTVAWLHVDEIVHLGHGDLGPLLRALGVVLVRVCAAVLVLLLALGLADVVVQRFQHERDLRMTRAEVKEEHRMLEGDPHVRARVRGAQREVAMRRMMAEVPRATVVVTNPTHFAVALRYERAGPTPGAPVVVAKGMDFLARRIRALAAAHAVPSHEDVALARALYRRVAVGQEVPEELYAAVAAVLAHVYRLEGAAR